MTTKIDRNYLLKRKHISLKAILLNEDNYRQKKDQKNIFASIKAHGLEDPLTVRPIDDTVKSEIKAYEEGYKFVVVDGDCRLEALKKIMQDDDQLEVGPQITITDIRKKEAKRLQLRLNGPRNDYTDYEWLLAIRDILEEEPKISVRKLGIEIGKSKSFAEQRMKFIREATVNDWTAVQTEFITVRKWYDSKVSTRGHLEEDSDESSLAGKLVQDGVVKQTIAIEGPEEKSTTKPPKFTMKTEIYEELVEEFPDVSFINVRRTGTHVGFDFAETDKVIKKVMVVAGRKTAAAHNIIQRVQPKQVPEEKRTTLLTKEQFDAIAGQLDYETEVQSYQPIGDHVHVLWREANFHYNTIQWLLNNKDKFPLDEDQLKLYTDLKPTEIVEVLEVEEEELVREVSDSEPCFIDVSQKEYDSFTEEIKYLISKEEKQKGGSKRVWFRTWVDNQVAFNWLKAAHGWETCVLAIPAKTFKKTNLQDILVDVKESFPELYQQLRILQKLTKTISPISNSKLMEICSSVRVIYKHQNDFVDQLLLNKNRRRIENGGEEHKKICDKCLQPKWMAPQQIICGNCEYQERQQKKNSAAASSSGGQQ